MPWKLRGGEAAIRYYMAARAIRPEPAHELAHALDDGESDEAIAVFQELTECGPATAGISSAWAGTAPGRGWTPGGRRRP